MTIFHYKKNFFLQDKLPFLTGFIFLIISLILIRLFYLQVLKGQYYSELSTDLLIREQKISAKRGRILDRSGKVLADSRPYLEIVFVPQHTEHAREVLHNLATFLSLEEESLWQKVETAKSLPKFEPVVLVENVPYNMAAKLKEHLAPGYEKNSPTNLEGIFLIAESLRNYLYPELFSHALGYLKEVDKKELLELKKDNPQSYAYGDLTGAAGLERTYDLDLRGKNGQRGRVVDARGHEIVGIPDINVLREKATFAPVDGYDLKTTLDFEAQQVASEFFKDKKGAVIALDPNNGEVFVMYSSPGYDANRIIKNIDKEYWKKINLDEDKYLFNRALQAMYPPASTYKIVGALAGLETGEIDPENTKFFCGGGLTFGNRRFRCWKSGGHGTLDLLKGIAQSCDVFFYQLGLKVGVDRLAGYSQLLGFNRLTGIDMPFEKSGLIPTTAWKEKARGQPWVESETLSVVIGQGYNLTTILQNAKVTALFANGGYEITPHLGKEILDLNGGVFKTISYPQKPTSFVGHFSTEFVKKGMIEVVQGHWTARRLQQSPHKIAGKTGTAQVVSSDSGKKSQTHALFVGFAPYDDPKIVVSVIMEYGGGGSSAAAPIAMKVIDTYLNK